MNSAVWCTCAGPSTSVSLIVTVAPGVQPADYMIGNEVAFDSVEAFNAAMQSPVRQKLRRHFREFPPFTGRNTHYPMNRTRLVG